MPVGTMDYSQTVFEQSFIGNCLKKSEKEECTISKEVKEEEAEEQVKEGQEFESEAKSEAEECTTSNELKKEEAEAEGLVFDCQRNPITGKIKN